MGRPLEFDREQALMQAMHLFWAKGYRATSLADLLQAMSLSRSSFYQSFHSKHHLFQLSIVRYRQLIVEDMSSRFQAADSGLEFIVESLNSVAEEAALPEGRIGCLVMNSANEFAQEDPIVAELVNEGIAAFEDLFFMAVQRAQEEGDISADENPYLLARYLVTSRSGLKTMAKAGATRRSLEEVIDVILKTLKRM